MAITPVWITGFEYGLAAPVTSGLGLFNTVTNGAEISIQGTTKRSGDYALRVHPTSSTTTAVGKLLAGSPTYCVGRFYVNWATLPSAYTAIAYIAKSAGTLLIGYSQSSNAIVAKVGDGTTIVGPTPVVNTWYRIDFRMYVGGTTWTVDWAVDGANQTQAVWTSQTATDLNTKNILFGNGDGATQDAYFDDIAVSVTSGDYPIGAGSVVGLRPNADGSHNLGGVITDEDTGTTNLYSKLDENPWITTANDDLILQSGIEATKYAEVAFADTTKTTINGVMAVLQYASSGTNANNGKTYIIDSDATASTVFSGDMSESSAYYKSVVVTPPAGGWTPAYVNSLVGRIGYSSDVTDVPYWLALMLEVDGPDTVAAATVDVSQGIGVIQAAIALFITPLLMSSPSQGVKVAEVFAMQVNPVQVSATDLSISVAETLQKFFPTLNINVTESGIAVSEAAPTIHPDPLHIYGTDTPIKVLSTTSVQADNILAYVLEGLKVAEQFSSWLGTAFINAIEETIAISENQSLAPKVCIYVRDEATIFLPELVLPVIEPSISLAESATILRPELFVSSEELGIGVSDSAIVQTDFLPTSVSDAVTLAEEFSLWIDSVHINAIEEGEQAPAKITVAEAATVDVTKPTADIYIDATELTIALSEYSALAPKSCIYVRDEATIFRPTLNVSVGEAIGVADTTAEFFPELTRLAIDATITVADTSALQRAYVPISVAEVISAADSAMLGEPWTPWLLDAATITEQALIQSFHFLEVAEAIGVSEWGDAGYWNVWLLDAATIAEQGSIFVEDVWLKTISRSEGIAVSESAAIAPTELHLAVSEGIGVADSGSIFVTTRNVPVAEAISIAESTEIFSPVISTYGIDLTVTVAEETTVHVAAVPISGSDAITVAESITTFWNTLNVPEGEGIGVIELGQIHVEGTGYLPIDLNFPLEDNLTITEEATLVRPTLFITAIEQTIGIHETETTWMAARNVPGTEKVITVSESATIEKQAFGRCHVIWVEPHNRIVDVKPKHRKHWVDTQPREA